MIRTGDARPAGRRPSGSVGAAVVIGVASWFALGKLLEALGADVLTAAGAALAAQWQRERAVLAATGPFPGGPEPGMMFSLAGITLGLAMVAVLITTGTAALRWATVPVGLAFVAVAPIVAVLGMGTVSRRSRPALTGGARPGAPRERHSRSRPPGHATPNGRGWRGAGCCRTR